jgi:hypothetical protein
MIKATVVICSLLVVCHFSTLHAQKKTDAIIERIKSRVSGISSVERLARLKKGVKKSNLARNGIEVIRTVSEEFVIIKADPHADNSLLLKKWFKEITPVNHLWKVADPLFRLDKGSSHYFTVKTTSGRAVLKTLAPVSGIILIDSSANVLTIYGSFQSILDHVTGIEHVRYVGIESTEPREESRVLDQNLNPNTVNQIHTYFPELNGEGMTLSIRELQYDPRDMDLSGRNIPSALSATEQSDHATAMATIAAGAGNSFVTGKGVAWSTNITSSGFRDLLADRDEDHAALDAWVQNHSYGTVIENFYGVLAESYDESANRVPHLLHIFSSGNQGVESSPHGAYQGVTGFANVTGNSKMAKNILTVGAVDTTGNPISFSSRGPAYDGRIKPELTAYSMDGTSNATALVSGTALLLQQSYRETWGALPASALLKALLINSARDAGAPGIDFITGFGNVDAFRTLQNLREERYFYGSVNHGEAQTFTFPVPAGARNLKVTLVWNDPAAEPNAGIALVNDLDMRIESSSGTTWLPWVLDASPEISKLASPAIRAQDHLNNIEQVTVPDIESGTCTISVEGYDVTGAQDFYIAYQWDTVDRFEWTFPTSRDNMPYNGETGTYFYWQSTLASNSGRLEYTVDNGATWKVIEPSVDLKKGYYRWSDIPYITARAQARMVVGETSYPTEMFTVSRPLSVSIGFQCSDSVMIQWPSLPGVDHYEISTFTGEFLEPIQTTEDTSLILKKEEYPQTLYAIQPVLEGDVRTIRSPTFDYTSLGTGCFLLSFLANAEPEEGIYLDVVLGTTYGVENIIFEYEEDGMFQQIGMVSPEEPRVRFLHDQPRQGLNRYRARISLSNGQEIVSDLAEQYFLTTTPFIVFPNPVSTTEELQVFSKQFATQDVTFRLYKIDGSLVLTSNLISDREYISVRGLLPGMYVYSITSEEGYFRGKIVVVE